MQPRKAIVKFVEMIVDAYGLHGLIHALIEVCYAKARTHDAGAARSWNAIAQALTTLEDAAKQMKVTARVKRAIERQTRRWMSGSYYKRNEVNDKPRRR